MFTNNNCSCNPNTICNPVSQCRSCLSITDSALNTQKIIQRQVRVASSMYTMNLAALTSIKSYEEHHDPSYKKGVDVKHNSYDRYLAKLKAGKLKTSPKQSSTNPIMGNKTQKYGMIQGCSC